MNPKLKLKNAIRVITSAAEKYHNPLEGYNYIFIFKNRSTNQIEYFESIFLSRNFQHLTGLEFIDSQGNLLHNPTQFYQKCVNRTLKENEIRFKSDGTTELKLQASKAFPVYKNIRYVAKGVKLNHLPFPDALTALISLENYTEK